MLTTLQDRPLSSPEPLQISFGSKPRRRRKSRIRQFSRSAINHRSVISANEADIVVCVSNRASIVSKSITVFITAAILFSIKHDLVTTATDGHAVHLEVAVSVVTLQLLTVEVVCPCDCL